MGSRTDAMRKRRKEKERNRKKKEKERKQEDQFDKGGAGSQCNDCIKKIEITSI